MRSKIAKNYHLLWGSFNLNRALDRICENFTAWGISFFIRHLLQELAIHVREFWSGALPIRQTVPTGELFGGSTEIPRKYALLKLRNLGSPDKPRGLSI